jgi:MFS family permease
MNNAFRSTIAARVLATYAVQIQAVILGIQVYQLTHDAFDLGLIGLAEALPALSLALFAGHWVDRSYPVWTYRMVITLSMTSIATSLFATSLFQLFASAVITGIARSFAAPSIQTIVARVVTRDQMSKSAAWLTIANRLALAVGPACAGIFFAWKGQSFAYSVALGASTLAFLSTFGIPSLIPNQKQNTQNESIWTSLKEGLSYVFKHPYLLPAFSLDMFSVLFGGVVAILPAFASEVLHTNEVGLGFLRASPAIGAVLASAYLTQKPIEVGAGKILFRVMAGYGLCTLVFACSRSLILSCGVLFLSGIFDSINMVIRGAITQLCSPNAMRGRIASVNAMFIGSSNEIGAFESGTAARLLGLVPSVFFGGSMTLLAVWLIYRWSPQMRTLNLKDLADQQAQ